MSKNYFLPLFFVFCAPLLASCSTITHGSTQQVSFKTIGAEDAYCDVLIGANDYRYNVRPPQTVWVQRSTKPMFITCTAPGNRTKNAMIESGVANSAYMNAATIGTTLAWDATTGAMYEYPEEITIDFSSALAKAQPLPSYENKGAIDPKAQAIEYLGEDTPLLPGDSAEAARYKAAYEEAARQDAIDAANAQERERRIEAVEGGFYGDKGGASRKNNSAVQISPLSDAAPTAAPQTLTAKPVARDNEGGGAFVPQANPQLGKPIFPDSTTF